MGASRQRDGRYRRSIRVRRAALLALLAVLSASAACISLRSADEAGDPPDRYPVRVLNDNFLNVRVDLVYRTGTRTHLGTALSFVETRVRPAADVLLRDEFFVELDLVGGATYRVPDPVDFPKNAVGLDVYVRPVLEQSYVSVR